MSRTSSSGGCRSRQREDYSCKRGGQACLGPHFQFYYFNPVGNDWGFVALVESIFKHLPRLSMKLLRKSGPFERK